MVVAVVASSAGTGVGMAIGGVAAVLVISAVFYAVGRGEDRDRAAARRAPEAGAALPEDGAEAGEAGEAAESPPRAAGSRLPATSRRRRRR
jgi:hypothetical protein